MTSLWLHGASVGDMRALDPVYRTLRASYPRANFWVTAWTTHGRQLGRDMFTDATVTQPPWPMTSVCRAALRRHQIQCAVFEYLELWPAWTKACEQLGIPMVILDGRITHKTLRIAPILRRSANRISTFCAQTDADARAAIKLGVHSDRVYVTGNGKFDGFPMGPAQASADLCKAIGPRDVVIGSLHPDEEMDFVHACMQSDVRVLVAPRYLSRVQKLLRALRQRNVCVGLRTEAAASARIVILDTIGELAAAYQLAPTAIIGGTFGRRQGQNLFEAALHNRVILYGPRHANVRQEVECLEGQGTQCVPTIGDALKMIGGGNIPRDPKTRQAIAPLRGATARHAEMIKRYLVAPEAREASVGHSLK